MGQTPPEDVQGQPERIKAGDLLPLVYDELRALARYRLSQERTDHTLQPTALVHEVYLKLAGSHGFASRAQFFQAAAEAMRRILIDHARAKNSDKRAGTPAAPMRRVPANVLDLAASAESQDIVAIDDAIEALARESPLAASVVRLRFYGGLSIDEAAQTLQISTRTINRHWSYARAWLYRKLNEET